MMAPKSFSSGLVTLCLSIILPCLALSSILELAFKNVAPKRPDNWNDLVARPLGAKTLYTRSIGGTVWWPQNMFPDEVGILNASSGMALVTVFIVSVLAICARRSGPAGTTKVRLAVLFVVALNSTVALIAFLFAFIQSRVSARVDVNYLLEILNDSLRGGNGLYEKGTFTSEIFTCGINDVMAEEFLVAEDFDDGMSHACALHMGARWLTLTTFVFSAALFAVIFVDSRREGHILHSSKSFYSAS